MAPPAPAAPVAAVMAASVPEVGNWLHALDTLPIANPWWLSWNKVARIHGKKSDIRERSYKYQRNCRLKFSSYIFGVLLL